MASLEMKKVNLKQALKAQSNPALSLNWKKVC